MRYATVVLVCAMFCASAVGATGDDAVRAYAESMARAIIANREAVLLENFAPIMRSNYSDADLLSPLERVRNEFGVISTYDFRRATAGGRIVGTQTIRTAIFWYALVTTKLPSGSFMKVELTYADGRYYLAGYSVIRFVGNDIPPELRKPPH